MQTTNPDQMAFHQETDTFDLTVTLNNNKLTVILKDYVDWAIYSKQYTEDDFGKEIHKKMDLNDMCGAFIQTKNSNDEESMRVKHVGQIELKKYEFGTVIENQNLPCYKVERQGKITVYLNNMDLKTKKKTTFESRLELTKLRNLTEKQISQIKSKTEKSELSKEIERQKREREILKKRIFILEQQNIKLREESRKTKQQLTIKIQQIYLKYDQKFQLQNQKIQMIQQQNKQHAEKVQLQTQRSLDKIAQLEAELKRVNKQSLKPESEEKPIKTIQDIHSLEQKYRDCFKIDGLKVQYSTYSWTQYIFNQPINHNQSAKFRLKIIQTKDNDIMIGVVQYPKQKDQRSSFRSGNAMCYYGNSAYKFPSGVKEGGGFKQGDVVEVDVNRSTNTIKYIVNGVLKATDTHDMLADSSRVFMPYVEMKNTNDKVEWLMD